MLAVSKHIKPSGWPNVLSVAGTDPSGGAGIQADLKTFMACGAYGMAVVTAIVAQNTQGVRRVEVLNPALVQQQYMAVADDVRIDAVKIGMLGNAAMVRMLAVQIARQPSPALVLDPVCESSSGHALLSTEGIQALRELLLPQVTVLTPNLAEAGYLLARPAPITEADMLAAAQDLRKLGPRWVCLKGGHRSGAVSADVLVGPDHVVEWLISPRQSGPYGHGTGCSFSSALAVGLATGNVLAAARCAKRFIDRALAAASQLQVGFGQGPLQHGYAWPGRRVALG